MNVPVKSSSITPFSSAPMGLGPGGPLPAPTPWTTYGSYLLWNGGIVVGNPTGGNMGPGTINATAYFVNSTPFDLGNYLPVTGGIINGSLTVNGPFIADSTVDGITIDMGTF